MFYRSLIRRYLSRLVQRLRLLVQAWRVLRGLSDLLDRLDLSDRLAQPDLQGLPALQDLAVRQDRREQQDLPDPQVRLVRQEPRVLLDLPALLGQLELWALLVQQELLERLGPPDLPDLLERPATWEQLARLDRQVLQVMLELRDLLDLLDQPEPRV